MRYTRRTLIGIAVSAVASEALAQPPSSAICSGNVRDIKGQGLRGWSVDMIDANGTRQSAPTVAEGYYEFKNAPKAGPYMLVFRNANAIAFHEVKQLTVGDRQVVSVTIDPQSKSFQSLYSQVQSVESVAAFATGYPGARQALASDLKNLPNALAALSAPIVGSGLPIEQVNFLKTKSENAASLVRGLFVA